MFLSLVDIWNSLFNLSSATTIDVHHLLEAPSKLYWMGTDSLGRDVFIRMLQGTRISLSVGFIAVGISTLVGIFIGAISGFFGGCVDRMLMSLVDIMLCFPTFFLILCIIALIDAPGIMPIIIVIGLTSWMGTARLVRAEIMSLKSRDFILAAKAIGASNARILLKHLIPNALGPVWVTATLGIASAILVESSLSFLGIGVQPPTPSWGNILMEGKASLGVAWWLLLFPGLAIFVSVISCYILAEFLRNKLNVRKK